ncbi:MAG: DUF3604 domain-containing protein [Burkholderiales bacterium]|nr:DUF3604 domain-containing protein [Burkholderiales bacterium]
MHSLHRHLLASAAALALIGPGIAQAQAAAAASAPAPAYSPHLGRIWPNRVYWGDEHVHTSWSGDAGAAGSRVGPEDALRFARGEEVTSTTGQKVRLSRPLDWMAVTDHSDGLGVIQDLIAGTPEMLADPVIRRWHEMIHADMATRRVAAKEMAIAQSNGQLPAIVNDPARELGTWQRETAIIEKFNDPGRFTAFIAYEWTSNSGGGNNLHRNVIYRDGKALADQVRPMTTFDSENPEDLWKWMAAWEAKTGGRLLAIPHNGNLSNGLMFALTAFDGTPLTREGAVLRARFEPLVEAMQIKGQSESHPSLSPTDEFTRGWEIWDKGNLNLLPKKPGMIPHEYAREALKNGLAIEQQLGVNPFKFGLVAGTDAHTGLSAIEADNYFGKFPQNEPSPKRMRIPVMDGATPPEGSVEPHLVNQGWEGSAQGWTGVWASANTREALWDAMQRRETYATTGTRMTVRFFGGFDYVAADAQAPDLARVGYTRGVPMGGDLRAAPAGKPLRFLIAALKDPQGANLDRVQVVKGWVDAAGKTHEKIFNVAWGDAARRRIDRRGQIPPVGNTVDLKTATWVNSIGDTQLTTVWTDPEFDPKQRAMYYLRVLEIPTPRWTLYDVVRFHVQPPKEAPLITQQRVFTSPIWYTPA